MQPIKSEADKIPPTPISEINLNVVDYYVREHLAGNQLSPRATEVAKAAIALQKAYSLRNYQSYTPSPDEKWPTTDEEAFQKAIDAFNDGHPLKGPSWNVKKAELPHHAVLGEHVTVRYRCGWEVAMLAGIVVFVHKFPTGKGLVIRPTESNHSLNLQPETGWRFIPLWMSSEMHGQSGFLFNF